MNIDELDIEELEKMFDEKETDLENIKHCIDILIKAKLDISDIEYCDSIYTEIENQISDLYDIQTSLENDLDDIQSQIDMINDNDPDEYEYMNKQYWASQF